jgi:hypothetical protein
MTFALTLLVFAVAGLALAQDSSQTPPAKAKPEAKPAEPAAGAEPEHIEVQHILIAFTGTRASKTPRTQEEAKKLAYEVLEKAKKGEDFDALVKQYTEDQVPGKYKMYNKDVKPVQGEFPRTGMVAAFGDVGFKLKVGEIGIADYDPAKSPFGYHIIKRTM